MRLIGLTGGIATGKSTVAAMLSGRGAVVVDADLLAREVLVPGAPAFDGVLARFGQGILDTSGAVDRAALGALVFADAARRAELEAITHPRIRELMQLRLAEAVESDPPLVVADIPLLFERGRDSAFPQTLLVYAPAGVQMWRLQDRDGLDETAARQRLAAQLPIDDKRPLATWVIDNGGTLTETAAQVESWWRTVVD